MQDNLKSPASDYWFEVPAIFCEDCMPNNPIILINIIHEVFKFPLDIPDDYVCIKCKSPMREEEDDRNQGARIHSGTAAHG